MKIISTKHHIITAWYHQTKLLAHVRTVTRDSFSDNQPTPLSNNIDCPHISYTVVPLQPKQLLPTTSKTCSNNLQIRTHRRSNNMQNKAETDRQTCCPVSFVQTACCITPNSPMPRVRSTVIQSSLTRQQQTGTLFTSLTPGSAAFFTRICYHTHAYIFYCQEPQFNISFPVVTLYEQ